MTPKFAPVPFAASNLTNTELVRLIEHQYPNLQGPLQLAVQRLAGTAGTTAERLPVPAPVQSCPHCGSAFTLEACSEDAEGVRP